ncbi:hypothetical protein STIAU_2823 [Stigmatella aurantiaca DW4/3-1]|uniref:Uncharacterized protein n=1 Tax=Stigmatella aurantiaca (strain DW4/3-1) TaxID=378806 RepID=Q09AE6_STIAD|nr:hypothetical protein STIAU_2823 [Stigmatella aurantiaca DW4/3-1]
MLGGHHPRAHHHRSHRRRGKARQAPHAVKGRHDGALVEHLHPHALGVHGDVHHVAREPEHEEPRGQLRQGACLPQAGEDKAVEEQRAHHHPRTARPGHQPARQRKRHHQPRRQRQQREAQVRFRQAQPLLDARDAGGPRGEAQPLQEEEAPHHLAIGGPGKGVPRLGVFHPPRAVTWKLPPRRAESGRVPVTSCLRQLSAQRRGRQEPVAESLAEDVLIEPPRHGHGGNHVPEAPHLLVRVDARLRPAPLRGGIEGEVVDEDRPQRVGVQPAELLQVHHPVHDGAALLLVLLQLDVELVHLEVEREHQVEAHCAEPVVLDASAPLPRVREDDVLRQVGKHFLVQHVRGNARVVKHLGHPAEPLFQPMDECLILLAHWLFPLTACVR